MSCMCGDPAVCDCNHRLIRKYNDMIGAAKTIHFLTRIHGRPQCGHCGFPWPCPTWSALDCSAASAAETASIEAAAKAVIASVFGEDQTEGYWIQIAEIMVKATAAPTLDD